MGPWSIAVASVPSGVQLCAWRGCDHVPVAVQGTLSLALAALSERACPHSQQLYGAGLPWRWQLHAHTECALGTCAPLQARV